MISKAKRNSEIDVLKAIGIISVVLGHTLYGSGAEEVIRKCIYIYHLPLFFFVSGYLFKIENLNSPITFLKKVVKSLYLPYLGYGAFYILVDFIYGEKWRPLAVTALKRLVFHGANGIAGPMWFCCWMFVAEVVFWIFMKTINRRKNSQNICAFLLCLLCVGLGMVSLQFSVARVALLDRVFLIIPVMYLGQIYRKHEERIAKLIKGWYWMPCLALILLLNQITKQEIEFSASKYYAMIGLYPMILIGLTFCLSLCRFLSRSDALCKSLCVVGRNTFPIMALHCTVFKIIDTLYMLILKTKGEVPPAFGFPYTFPKLRIFYVLLGVALPAIIGELLFKRIRYARHHRHHSDEE